MAHEPPWVPPAPPHSGAQAPEDPQRDHQRLWPAVLGVVVLALALMSVRCGLVLCGLLFGATRIVLVDIVISAAALISAAWLYRRRLSTNDAKGEGMPSAVLASTVGVLGFPAVIGGALNLVAPPSPGDLSAPACATVQTYNTPYRAVTTGPLGNFARSGPGLGFAQTDRFSKDCSIGFSGYCIGDPVGDPVVSGWNDTRWLLAARHGDGAGSVLARWLSKEPVSKRFVSNAYLAPQTSDAQLGYLGDHQCAGGLPLPAKATLTSKQATGRAGKAEPGVIALTAQAAHAFNIGIALAIDRPQALDAGTALRQIPGSGAVQTGNAVHAQWDTTILRAHLSKPLTAPVTVTILAVPCLDPLAPAAANTSALLGFRIPAEADKPLAVTRPALLSDDLRKRLTTLACDTAHREQPSSGWR